MPIRILGVSTVLTCAAALSAGLVSTATVTCNNSASSPTATVTGTSSASYAAICSLMGVPKGAADATAAFGSVTAQAKTDIAGPGTVNDTAFGQFTDQITIGGSTGTGFVSYIYDVTFNGSADGGKGNSRFLAISDDGSLTNVGVLDLFGTYSLGTTFAAGEPPSIFGVHVVRTSSLSAFTFGTPFNFGASAQSNASGELVFANLTAKLLDIVILDNNKQPVPGATVTALSKTQYPIPEPGSAMLLGLGTGVVALRFARRAGTYSRRRTPASGA